MVLSEDRQFSANVQGGNFAATTGWLEVGDQRFAMVFRGPGGWSSSAAQDEAIATALAAHPQATIHSGGEKFAFLTAGLTDALAAASAACGAD